MNQSQASILDSKVKSLPESPGVYEFLDKQGNIIYIGKAKNLKKRVSSYFSKNKHDSFKVKVLVDHIYSLTHIVVNTESDALLLENNLIKEHQPRYNVLLKDDKTFPWICIKNEPFPRVFSTRNESNGARNKTTRTKHCRNGQWRGKTRRTSGGTLDANSSHDSKGMLSDSIWLLVFQYKFHT